jgi:hypothetical protein
MNRQGAPMIYGVHHSLRSQARDGTTFESTGDSFTHIRTPSGEKVLVLARSP